MRACVREFDCVCVRAIVRAWESSALASEEPGGGTYVCARAHAHERCLRVDAFWRMRMLMCMSVCVRVQAQCDCNCLCVDGLPMFESLSSVDPNLLYNCFANRSSVSGWRLIRVHCPTRTAAADLGVRTPSHITQAHTPHATHSRSLACMRTFDTLSHTTIIHAQGCACRTSPPRRTLGG